MYYVIAWLLLFIINTGIAQVICDPNFTEAISNRTSKKRMLLLFVGTPIFTLGLLILLLLIGGDILYKWAKAQYRQSRELREWQKYHELQVDQ